MNKSKSGFTPLENSTIFGISEINRDLIHYRKNGVKTQSFQTGFTLIELLVALAILSLITLIIGIGFRLGIKAWERGEKETTETQRLRTLSGFIYQNIKSAYPYKTEIDGKKVVLFEGDKNSVMLAAISAAGFKWVKYSSRDGVFLFNEGILPDKNLLHTISDSGNEEIIDSDIGEVQFQYLSSDEDDWKESWDFGDKLPAAVKVKITYFEPFLIAIPLGLQQQ